MGNLGIVAVHQPGGRHAVVALRLDPHGRPSIEEILVDTWTGDITRSYVTESEGHWRATWEKGWILA